MVKMWTILFFVAALVAWPDSSQGQPVYLTTFESWSFYKVRASGPMTNSNVKATCEAAGMRYPCHYSGSGWCTTYWTSDCIMYGDADDVQCAILWTLAETMCRYGDPRACQPLDDTFVCKPNWEFDVRDSAYGVDYQTSSWSLYGADYNNMYALCAVPSQMCNGSPCVYGTCTSDNCTCDDDWEGANCEQTIGDCASSPCAHGTCTDGHMSYACSCDNGWAGVHCDQGIDECASNPCWLGGTCLDEVDGYICVCPKDATGKNCETVSFTGECYQFSPTALTHQDATQACSTMDSHLVDLTDEQQQSFLADKMAATTGASVWLAMKTTPAAFLYSNGSPFSGPIQWSPSEPAAPCDLCVLLDSSDNFLGKTAPCTDQHNYVCQSDLKPCGQNVCQNGGICTSCFNDTAAFCDCTAGFGGKNCEIDINECASTPCQNGGSCRDSINSYSCNCLTGFHGDHCENDMNWCSQAQCPQDWVCQDYTFYFQCVHPAPITSRMTPYQCSSASCPDGMYCTEESVASFSCKAE